MNKLPTLCMLLYLYGCSTTPPVVDKVLDSAVGCGTTEIILDLPLIEPIKYNRKKSTPECEK